jgi:hypothetical protein
VEPLDRFLTAHGFTGVYTYYETDTIFALRKQVGGPVRSPSENPKKIFFLEQTTVDKDYVYYHFDFRRSSSEVFFDCSVLEKMVSLSFGLRRLDIKYKYNCPYNVEAIHSLLHLQVNHFVSSKLRRKKKVSMEPPDFSSDETPVTLAFGNRLLTKYSRLCFHPARETYFELELKKQLCHKTLFSLLKEKQYALFDDKVKTVFRAEVSSLQGHPLIAELHAFLDSSFFKASYKVARVNAEGKYPFHQLFSFSTSLSEDNGLSLLTLVLLFSLIEEGVVFNSSVSQVSFSMDMKTLIDRYGLPNHTASRIKMEKLLIKLCETTFYFKIQAGGTSIKHCDHILYKVTVIKNPNVNIVELTLNLNFFAKLAGNFSFYLPKDFLQTLFENTSVSKQHQFIAGYILCRIHCKDISIPLSCKTKLRYENVSHFIHRVLLKCKENNLIQTYKINKLTYKNCEICLT